MDWERLGKQLRDARQRAGLTQRDVAATAGVNHTYVSHLENGARDPTVGTLEAIADAVGVSLRVDVVDASGLRAMEGAAAALSTEDQALLLRLARVLPLLDSSVREREVLLLEARAGLVDLARPVPVTEPSGRKKA